jgi:hypothetical protein
MSQKKIIMFEPIKLGLTPATFEVPVPSQKRERSCICVARASILPLSTILILDF